MLINNMVQCISIRIICSNSYYWGCGFNALNNHEILMQLCTQKQGNKYKKIEIM